MTIGAILQRKGRNVLSVDGATTVHEAVDLLAEKRIGALPVTEGGRVAGVFSERDVIYRLRSDGAAMLDWPVARVMTSPAVTVTAEVSILAALSQMTRRRIRHLPVVDGEDLVGIVSIGDLVKYRLDRMEHETEAMRAYIMSV
jgi:CBS domain-containing protein